MQKIITIYTLGYDRIIDYIIGYPPFEHRRNLYVGLDDVLIESPCLKCLYSEPMKFMAFDHETQQQCEYTTDGARYEHICQIKIDGEYQTVEVDRIKILYMSYDFSIDIAEQLIKLTDIRGRNIIVNIEGNTITEILQSDIKITPRKRVQKAPLTKRINILIENKKHHDEQSRILAQEIEANRVKMCDKVGYSILQELHKIPYLPKQVCDKLLKFNIITVFDLMVYYDKDNKFLLQFKFNEVIINRLTSIISNILPY